MSASGEVVIIGAGPYGLSLAAHLRSRGVEFRILGSPMSNWQTRMPRGMLLKSDGYASNLSDPGASSTLKDFCVSAGFPYADEGLPVDVDHFIAYGKAFQRRHVSTLEERLVVALERAGDGFLVRLDDGESISAAKVVVAVGISDFPYLPPSLAKLPGELLSHSSQHRQVDGFAGREVAVVGSGSSAIDLAGLFHEHGASVQLVTRQSQLRFHTRTTLDGRPLRERLRDPNTGIGPGWRNVFYTRTPLLFRRLSADRRHRIVNTSHGPAGGWYMRDRILGQISVLTGHAAQGAELRDGRIELSLSGPDGAMRTLAADHVVAATGYRVDLRRIKFLGDALRAEISSIEHIPELSRNFETSVPGLYIVGPAAAHSFGPMMRFVFGAEFAATSVCRHLAATLRRPMARGAALPAKAIRALRQRPEEAGQ